MGETNLLTYLKKYSKKSEKEENSKKKEGENKDRVSDGNMVKETPQVTSKIKHTNKLHTKVPEVSNSITKKPVSKIGNLIRKGSSIEVDPVYQNINKKDGVGVISRIMFSNIVEYKEPNMEEIRKISL